MATDSEQSFNDTALSHDMLLAVADPQSDAHEEDYMLELQLVYPPEHEGEPVDRVEDTTSRSDTETMMFPSSMSSNPTATLPAELVKAAPTLYSSCALVDTRSSSLLSYSSPPTSPPFMSGISSTSCLPPSTVSEAPVLSSSANHPSALLMSSCTVRSTTWSAEDMQTPMDTNDDNHDTSRSSLHTGDSRPPKPGRLNEDDCCEPGSEDDVTDEEDELISESSEDESPDARSLKRAAPISRMPRKRQHIAKWSCPIAGCSQSFTRKQDVERHMTTVLHGSGDADLDQIYSDHNESSRRWCSWCFNIFTRGDSRRRHEIKCCRKSPRESSSS